MKIRRIATLAALIAGASIGLAATASAEPLDGPYGATVTGGNVLPVGENVLWLFTPCGPDCALRKIVAGPDSEFHLQGNTWTSTFGNATETIDAGSLAATTNQPDGFISWQLKKGG